MDNRPQGRKKYVSGKSKSDFQNGTSHSGGPVGKADGYSGRKPQSNPQNTSGSSLNTSGNNSSSNPLGSLLGGGSSSGGQTTRQGCGILPIIIIGALIILMLTKCGGSFLGGDNSTGDLLGSLLGGGGTDITSLFGGNASASQGWVTEANTGSLDTSVVSNARAKRTQILGNNRDVVTIMVYLCGTDLESRNGMATSDLAEMQNATISSNVNLIVFTGGCSKWKNNVVSSSVNQIYKVESGNVRCLEQNAGNDSMVKPATLANFIKYCSRNFPANRYELIMWDHGGGSISGYGYDEKNKMAGSMPLSGIKEALSQGGVTFDFVGFDACLMGTLENALMLNDYADYLIASEETEPGVGWYYTNWLTKLSQNTSMPTTEIGKNIIDDFVAECARKCPGQKTTLSLIDLAELSATVPESLKSFSASTTELMKTDGYKKVSDARSKTREFAPTTKIDQIDLVNLALNIGTDESKALADSLLSAVKYNKTSSNMTNAYGISIYFPYKKTSKVGSAVQTYNDIGMDSSYADCIQRFASLEVSGQAASGGSSNPLSTILGEATGSSTASAGDLTDLLGSLLGGDFSGLSGITESSGGLGNLADLASNFGFLGNNIDVQNDANYISQNQLDSSLLKWTDENGTKVLRLSEDQWKLVHELVLNVWYDNGEGYIDLGTDNVFDFTADGALIGEYDGTWLAIDGITIPYYYVDSVEENGNSIITGRVPVLLNGTRANLLIVFDDSHPEGYIAGATIDYINGETETVAKSMVTLENGDVIEFMYDFYGYDGTFRNNYTFGEKGKITYNGNHKISNAELYDTTKAKPMYIFTDLYNNEKYTEVIE
ncbi:MAG: peptidase C11 [Clostridia bacterium]|nr:peptidase C11 [Clostridia bacterium]